MVRRVPIAASRIGFVALIAGAVAWSAPQGFCLCSSVGVYGSFAVGTFNREVREERPPRSQSGSQASFQSDTSADPSQSQTGSSSSKPHHGTVRHTRAMEDAPAPELAEAEGLIQKKNYTAAEPLLQKVVAADASNYVAWFELGFVENGLGKIE